MTTRKAPPAKPTRRASGKAPLFVRRNSGYRPTFVRPVSLAALTADDAADLLRDATNIIETRDRAAEDATRAAWVEYGARAWELCNAPDRMLYALDLNCPEDGANALIELVRPALRHVTVGFYDAKDPDPDRHANIVEMAAAIVAARFDGRSRQSARDGLHRKAESLAIVSGFYVADEQRDAGPAELVAWACVMLAEVANMLCGEGSFHDGGCLEGWYYCACDFVATADAIAENGNGQGRERWGELGRIAAPWAAASERRLCELADQIRTSYQCPELSWG